MWGSLLGFAAQQANTPEPGDAWQFGDIGETRFGGTTIFGPSFGNTGMGWKAWAAIAAGAVLLVLLIRKK